MTKDLCLMCGCSTRARSGYFGCCSDVCRKRLRRKQRLQPKLPLSRVAWLNATARCRLMGDKRGARSCLERSKGAK